MSEKRNFYSREEDLVIRCFANKKTGAEIGIMLSRTASSVYTRMWRLGISGQKVGENHHSAKLSELQVQMAVVLRDAGFSVYEVHKAMLSHVSLNAVYNRVRGWGQDGFKG